MEDFFIYLLRSEGEDLVWMTGQGLEDKLWEENMLAKVLRDWRHNPEMKEKNRQAVGSRKLRIYDRRQRNYIFSGDIPGLVHQLWERDILLKMWRSEQQLIETFISKKSLNK